MMGKRWPYERPLEFEKTCKRTLTVRHASGTVRFDEFGASICQGKPYAAYLILASPSATSQNSDPCRCDLSLFKFSP